MAPNKQNKYLNEIIEKAFDFLKTAIEEFNKKPKYFIISFSTAVELGCGLNRLTRS